MLAYNDIAEYIADNYGVCSREADCYHGRDSMGRYNGCLRIGWRGRGCPYWNPVDAGNWDELHKALVKAGAR